MRNYLYISPSNDGWQNLATDEWMLDHIEDDQLMLYFYVNKNAVILGKNQNPWKECDMTAMETDGVQLVRRITGGGAVYHDCGNLNFSFIAGKDRYDLDKQMAMLFQGLRSVGIACEFSGRNDLLADGKKFSGNAFCTRNGARQHHGTLLIDSDLTKLQNYLQVDPKKLAAKGVSSVRSRVCNLKEIQPNLSVGIMISTMRQAFRKAYGDYYTWEPSDDKLEEISQYMEKHSSWDWRIGATPRFDLELSNRFTWGGIQLLLTLREGKVDEMKCFSDALDIELPDTICQLLQGVAFGAQPLSQALMSSSNEQIRDLAAFVAEQSL